jgi:alanyl-tRNA synthetase
MNWQTASIPDFSSICEEFWQRQGSIIRESQPLCQNDPTVMFVNAGITLFKPRMLAGEEIPLTTVVQKCLRTYWNRNTCLLFRMLTVVAMGSRLNQVTAATFDLLESLGYDRNKLAAVVSPSDSDLLAAVSMHVASAQLRLQEGNTPEYWTHWDFGHQDILVGRGLTIICAEENQDLSLGNIIVVENMQRRRQYLDVGFGIERLALGLGYEEAGFSAARHSFIQYNLRDEDQRKLFYYLDAALNLIWENVQPSAHKRGYVLRKLLRSVSELLSNDISIVLKISESVMDVSGADASRKAEAIAVIEREISGYISGSDNRRRAAQRYLAAHRNESPQRLREYVHDTYGLNTQEIEALFAPGPSTA